MKRNIGCIALDSSLAGWLLEQLRTSQKGTPSTQELMEGLRDLMEGNCSQIHHHTGSPQDWVLTF